MRPSVGGGRAIDFGAYNCGANCASSATLGCGVVYAAGAVGARFTYGGTVYKFQDATADGASPVGDLAAYKGALFGVTRAGGAFGQGVAYRVEP